MWRIFQSPCPVCALVRITDILRISPYGPLIWRSKILWCNQTPFHQRQFRYNKARVHHFLLSILLLTSMHPLERDCGQFFILFLYFHDKKLHGLTFLFASFQYGFACVFIHFHLFLYRNKLIFHFFWWFTDFVLIFIMEACLFAMDCIQCILSCFHFHSMFAYFFYLKTWCIISLLLLIMPSSSSKNHSDYFESTDDDVHKRDEFDNSTDDEEDT